MADHTTENNSSRLTARLHSPDSCIISVTAGIYYVSEVAEQLAWLAATVQPSRREERIVARYPRIKDVRMSSATEESSAAIASALCEFEFRTSELKEPREWRLLDLLVWQCGPGWRLSYSATTAAQNRPRVVSGYDGLFGPLFPGGAVRGKNCDERFQFIARCYFDDCWRSLMAFVWQQKSK
jgi:hypothetical protein